MPTPNKGESKKDYVSRCIPIRQKEGKDKDVKQSAAICYSMWDQAKSKKTESNQETIDIIDNFTKKLDKVYAFDSLKESDEEPATCDVCKEFTFSFQDTEKDIVKKRIRKYPLNKQHRGTYRQHYEFMLKDNVWKATMKKDNKYICLECWERDYLTPFLKNKNVRKPNDFGFYQVTPEDLVLGNPVNNNVADFFNAVVEEKKVELQKKQLEKDKKMIGSYDMEHGFDD